MHKYYILVIILGIFLISLNYIYYWKPTQLNIQQHQFNIHYLRHLKNSHYPKTNINSPHPEQNINNCHPEQNINCCTEQNINSSHPEPNINSCHPEQNINSCHPERSEGTPSNTNFFPSEITPASIINQLTNHYGIKINSIHTKLGSFDKFEIQWLALEGQTDETNLFNYLSYLVSGKFPIIITDFTINQKDNSLNFSMQLALIKHYQLKPALEHLQFTGFPLFCQKAYANNRLLLTEVPISTIVVNGYLQQGDLTTTVLSAQNAHALGKVGDIIGIEHMRIQSISPEGLQFITPNQKKFFLSYSAKHKL